MSEQHCWCLDNYTCSYCEEKGLYKKAPVVNIVSKWNERFLGLAKHISSWSKDNSTKVGAVITDSKHRIISQGFNGLPRGIKDTDERYNNRELKYEMIVHAEANALIFAKQDLEGCTLYTYPFSPCSRCASLIIQSGIKRVIFPVLPDNLKERWGKNIALSLQMFKEANIEVEEVCIE